MKGRALGDGSVDPTLANTAIEVEVRMFNSLTRYAEGLGRHRRLPLKPGGTVGDVLSMLGIPPGDVFLVLVNGRDITPGMIGDPVRTSHRLEHGDVVALSGPVPYTLK
jgi:hypothetical protein